MTVLEITPAVRTAKRKWVVPRTLCVIYSPWFFSQDSVFSLLSFLPFSLFFLLFLCSFLFRFFFFLCPSFPPSHPPLSLFDCPPTLSGQVVPQAEPPLFALGRTANVLLQALFPLRVPVPSPGTLAVHSWTRVAGEAAPGQWGGSRPCAGDLGKWSLCKSHRIRVQEMSPKLQFELLSPTLPERRIEPWAGKKLFIYVCPSTEVEIVVPKKGFTHTWTRELTMSKWRTSFSGAMEIAP